MCINNEGLYVFDFHPIHIALNTRTYNDYQNVKDKIINNKEDPFNLSFPGKGSRDFFESFVKTFKLQRKKSFTCSNALSLFIKNNLKMNILITGSQGYIGKLCEMLCTKHRVTGLTSSKIKNDKNMN